MAALASVPSDFRACMAVVCLASAFASLVLAASASCWRRDTSSSRVSISARSSSHCSAMASRSSSASAVADLATDTVSNNVSRLPLTPSYHPDETSACSFMAEFTRKVKPCASLFTAAAWACACLASAATSSKAPFIADRTATCRWVRAAKSARRSSTSRFSLAASRDLASLAADRSPWAVRKSACSARISWS